MVSNRCPVCGEWATCLDGSINLPSCWSNHTTFRVHYPCLPEAERMKIRGLCFGDGLRFFYPTKMSVDDEIKFEKEEAMAGRGPIAERLDAEDYRELHRLEEKKEGARLWQMKSS